jgi:23S rRNA (cytosine1962-C5)-methyltransferase
MPCESSPAIVPLWLSAEASRANSRCLPWPVGCQGATAVRTLRLPVPSPALPARLDRFLVANVPDLSRRQVKGLIDADQVRVDGRSERRAGRKLRPGEVVELNYRPSWQGAQSLEGGLSVAARGEGWWVVHKPAGLSSHRDAAEDRGSIAEAIAETLGLGPDEATAVHRLDRGTSGLLLVALAGEPRARLSALFEDRQIHKRYLAIVHPAPSAEAGQLSGPEIDGRATDLNWQLVRRSTDGSRGELQVEPQQGRTHQIRIQLAAAGWPIVGDLDYGQPLPGGARRMALHASHLSCDDFDVSWPQPEDWDSLLEPDEAARGKASPPSRAAPAHEERAQRARRASGSSAPGGRQVQISRASARIIKGGHPWLLRDRWTADLEGMNSGDLAWLVDERGDYVATALLDPSQELCGRVVSRDDRQEITAASFEQRAQAAVSRRQQLLQEGGNNAIRMIHGEADGLPGFSVDLWGEVLVATLATDAARTMAAAAYRGLQAGLGDLPLYERDHFVDLRSRDPEEAATLPGRWIQEPRDAVPDSWQVLEHHHRFWVQPLGGLSTGLYPDQRDNRGRLARLVAQQNAPQIANLFSHTGAFSVACASAGAGRVFSVDLSRPYGDLASRNLEANGHDPGEHPVVVADAVEWLEQERPELDGVILDPPSRASGRRARSRGWSSRRDYSALVAAAARQLRPGGWMLCASNLRGVPRGWLKGQITAGFKAAGRPLPRLEGAPTSSDFPPLRGFPEGRCFQASLVFTDR